MRRSRDALEEGRDEPKWRTIPESVLRPGRPLSPQRRAELWRLVSRHPQVVTRAGAGIKSARALKGHFDYISRGGILPLLDREGMHLKGRPALEEMAKDWASADAADSRRRPNAVLARPLIVTAPPGSPPRAVFSAAYGFAAAHDGLRHDFVLALHTDRSHPHAHIVFRALGDDGVRLIWDPPDLEMNRRRFAQALRDQGLEVDASSRLSRGLVGRNPPQRYWRALEQYWEGYAPPPRAFERTRREALDLAEGRKTPDGREIAVVRTQARVREAFERLAADLDRSPETDDRALAQGLRRFVNDMPAPVTDRVRMARDIRQRARDQNLSRERERSR